MEWPPISSAPVKLNFGAQKSGNMGKKRPEKNRRPGGEKETLEVETGKSAKDGADSAE